MREVKQLERILGQEYGIIPNQLNNTWWNRYTEHIKEKNFKLKDGFLQGLVLATIISLKGLKGFYNPRTHTIFTPQKEDNFIEFATYHELAHGYNYQKNKKFLEVTEELCSQKINILKGKNFDEKIILKGFLHKCVDEGIADYLAIQSQKLKAQEEKRQMINGVTPINFPLNFETAKKIKLDSFTLMVGYSAIKSASGIKRIIFCSYLEELFENLPYFFGYYLVRTRLKNKQEGIGKEVDKLLMNPPKSIEEFSNEVLSGFRE